MKSLPAGFYDLLYTAELKQRLEAAGLNSIEMNKHITAFILFDESEPLFFIKPFYFTF